MDAQTSIVPSAPLNSLLSSTHLPAPSSTLLALCQPRTAHPPPALIYLRAHAKTAPPACHDATAALAACDADRASRAVVVDIIPQVEAPCGRHIVIEAGVPDGHALTGGVGSLTERMCESVGRREVVRPKMRKAAEVWKWERAMLFLGKAEKELGVGVPGMMRGKAKICVRKRLLKMCGKKEVKRLLKAGAVPLRSWARTGGHVERETRKVKRLLEGRILSFGRSLALEDSVFSSLFE